MYPARRGPDPLLVGRWEGDIAGSNDKGSRIYERTLKDVHPHHKLKRNDELTSYSRDKRPAECVDAVLTAKVHLIAG